MILTSDLLLESVKRGISFPANSSDNLDDEDILAFAYEECVGKIYPLLQSLRQEYLIAPPYTISLVSGTAKYRMPPRALGRTLRDIYYVDGSGNQRPLPKIQPERKHEFMPTTSTTGIPQAYYLENDYIVPVPIPSDSAADLVITYPLRPSKIVTLERTMVTTYVDALVLQHDNGLSGTDAFVGLPLDPDTEDPIFTTATAVDVISATSGNIFRFLSITPTTVEEPTGALTFTAGVLDTTVEIGDYVCLAGESPVVPIPEEAHVVLARAVQNRILEAIDDMEGLKAGEKQLELRMKELAELLTPRVMSAREKILGAGNRVFLQGGNRRFPRITITGS